MKKSSKIWLWIALVLCLCTTGLNLAEGRWLSVAIAILSIAGLCALLLAIDDRLLVLPYRAVRRITQKR